MHLQQTKLPCTSKEFDQFIIETETFVSKVFILEKQHKISIRKIALCIFNKFCLIINIFGSFHKKKLLLVDTKQGQGTIPNKIMGF